MGNAMLALLVKASLTCVLLKFTPFFILPGVPSLKSLRTELLLVGLKAYLYWVVLESLASWSSLLIITDRFILSGKATESNVVAISEVFEKVCFFHTP